MKEILLKSLKLYGKCVLASIMCFFMVVTFNFVGTALFTKNIGYTVYGTLEGEEKQTELYTYYTADGEDLKKQEYIDKGYTLNQVSVRSEMSKKADISWGIICLIFTLLIMGSFIYNELWNSGFKDSNLVRIGSKKEDKFKGFKVGLIITIPSFIFLTLAVIGVFKNLSVAGFALLNSHLYEALILISGGGYLADLSTLKIIVIYALFFLNPLIAHFAYIIGYKEILLFEKIAYKKK